jgi:hypothetical protein
MIGPTEKVITSQNKTHHRAIKPGRLSKPRFASEDNLRERFVAALVSHGKSEMHLTDIVAEMIEQDVERDEAIEWGIEAGVSEEYVRVVVSRLYSAAQGHVRAKGGGRKRNPTAIQRAEKLVKECRGDLKAAKRLALAIYRQIEKMLKASDSEA